jgi:hypothetical protein
MIPAYGGGEHYTSLWTTESWTIHLPGLSFDEDMLLNHLLRQLHARTPRNILRESYYDGRRAVQQVGTIIPPQYYNLGLTLGWSAKAVDALAQRTNLDRFVWTDGDLNSLGFRDVWEQNYFGAESNAAFVASLIHGVAFLINTNGTSDEPDSLIHIKDGLSATGDYNPRTRRMDNLLSITGWCPESKAPTELALYLDGETITAVRDGGEWFVDRVQHPYGVPVEALVYRPQVRRPFGTSRISRPVMAIHDQAIRTLIRMEGHADVFSYPELWMLGADEGVFRNADGSVKPSWQVMLGRIKGVPDDPDADPQLARADIKQFQAHSPQPHIDLFQQHANNFSGQTSIPVTELGVQARTNTTTADGTDAADRALVRTAEDAMSNWAPALRRAMTRALAIQNGLTAVPAEWQTIDTKWRNPEYLSQSAVADAGMKKLAAVPWLAETEVGLELLGLDDQQIARAMSEKRRAVGTATVMRSALDALKQQQALPAAPDVAAAVTEPTANVPSN